MDLQKQYLSISRNKLIDLSKRNRLINFNLNAKRPKHLDIVDACLDQVWKAVSSGVQIPINFVPEPDLPDDQNSGERTPRPNPIEFAKECGINPSLELEVESQKDEPKKLSGLQSLLYYPELERFIQKLRDEARAASEEKGINTMHCMVGFLQWSESKDSSIVITSPLLLNQVDFEIERRVFGHQRFLLSGQELDHEGWIVNPSLRVKLQNDYGIELPLLEPDELPTSYFEKVSSILSFYPEWSITPRAALGNVAFPRLALYEDLDLQRWEFEEGNLLLEHPILKGLLSGICREPSDQIIQDVDNDGIARPIEGLVFDADSSQLEAIRRVLDGETMALEGPPGTGKSQTIANLISAYLSRGKRVLFVADKKAAIEVVEQRLAKVGLSDYCLNLHNDDRHSKTALYDRLEKRLELSKSKTRDEEIDRTYRELASKVTTLTSILDSYYDELMVKPEQALSTVNDLLWSSLKTRQEYESLSSVVKKISISSTLDLSQTTLESCKGLLKNLETAFEDLNCTPQKLRNHTLWILNKDFLDPFQVEELNLHILELGEKIGRIIKLLGLCEGIDDCTTVNLRDCLQLEAITPLQNAQIDEVLYRRMQQCSNPLGIAKKLRTLVNQFPDLVKSKNPVEYIRSLSETIEKKLDYLKSSMAEEVGHCCKEAIKTHETILLHLNQYSSFLAQALPDVYKRESNEWGQYMLDFQRVLKHAENIDDQLITFIQNGLSRAEFDWDKISTVADESVECDKLFDELKTIFCEDLLFSHNQIEQFAKELLPAGFFRQFSGAWRRCFQSLSENFLSNLSLGKQVLLTRLSQLQKWSHKTKVLEQNKLELGLVSDNVTFNTEDMTNLLKARESEIQLATVAESLYQDLVKSGRSILDILQLAKNSFNENVAGVLSNLYPYLCNTQTCHIEDIIQKAKNEYNKSLSLAKALNEYGLNDNEDSATLHKLSMKIDEILQSEELLEFLSDWSVEEIIKSAETVETIFSATANKKSQDFLSSINFKDLNHIGEIVELAQQVKTLLLDLHEEGYLLPGSIDNENGIQHPLIDLGKWQNEIAAEMTNLTSWMTFRQALTQLKEHGPEAYEFAKQLIEKDVPLESLSKLFDIIVSQSKAKEAVRGSEKHLKSMAADIQRVQKDFRTFDRKTIDHGCRWTQKVILSKPIHQGSRSGKRSEWTGLELIRHELGKQKRRIPSRKLLKRALQALLDLMPCFMMSPLNAAQYLQASRTPLFDLVVIDEASQLRPEEAFSAIVRGSQLLVVGDSKQLPPTSFFGAILEEDEVDDEDAIDNESILDMAKAMFPSHSLRWHYRSKHDSLIYFSNQQFYDERLIVCPSSLSESELVGVHLIKANGIYKRGENPKEASIVIDKAIKCMDIAPDQSIGIVAMNRQQQDLLQTLLYEAQCNNKKVNSYLDHWEEENERCFVKNLENVQGDERDIILISTVYGPAENGSKVLRRFGPINSKHGHRRLNVLCTRARACMYVVTSLKPSDILPPGDVASSKGIESFAKFIEYAGSGQRLAKEYSDTPDSPFEEFVGEFLANAGYDVQYQIGQSGFRIDIGIRHPIHPYGFIAGIECDGATYHSHKFARDRDRLRQEILENHGWKIYRIWSTDWFHQPKSEQEKLLAWLSSRINELQKNKDNNHLSNSTVEQKWQFKPITTEKAFYNATPTLDTV